MEYTRRSRGLAVEYAILGYLVEAPMHGYELRERLSGGLGAFWRVGSSQLYQVLHRLDEQGWVSCSVEPTDAGPPRNVYEATAAGREAFWSWATSPVRHVRQVRVEFLAKIYFLRKLDPDRIGTLVDGQLDRLRELYGHLKTRGGLESDDVDLGRLAASYRRSQIAGTIRWIEEHERELGSGGERL